MGMGIGVIRANGEWRMANGEWRMANKDIVAQDGSKVK
jgi:hypothetical protein